MLRRILRRKLAYACKLVCAELHTPVKNTRSVKTCLKIVRFPPFSFTRCSHKVYLQYGDVVLCLVQIRHSVVAQWLQDGGLRLADFP